MRGRERWGRGAGKGRRKECLEQLSERNETFTWTRLSSLARCCVARDPKVLTLPPLPLPVSRHKSFTVPSFYLSHLLPLPPLPLFPLRSLSSAFVSFCQSIGSQSHSLVYFSRGNPLTRPRSRPSCLWREMGRRSYCGSATSSPASGEWRNKLEASRLSCGEAMDDEETVFNETHYIYCV